LVEYYGANFGDRQYHTIHTNLAILFNLINIPILPVLQARFYACRKMEAGTSAREMPGQKLANDFFWINPDEKEPETDEPIHVMISCINTSYPYVLPLVVK
jgi:hypothetical protein